jgi:transposase|tara:strand:- start:197 stop:388 length:192 start_codon:yes stop_codon:yes gene_type:complete
MGMHSQNMRNYVDHRNTNASAKAFNTKIKAFRAPYRGVTNINYLFFLASQMFLLNAKIKQSNQ